MEITTERWRYINDYAAEVFGRQDGHLAGLMTEGVARGLPDIAVSPETGRLLMLLTLMTRGKLAIEVGTLGGYSGIWIARGLQPTGKLITVEPNPLHIEFAQEQFIKAGVGNRVEVVRGTGLEALPELAKQVGPESVDVVFLDAIKAEYPDYWKIIKPLMARGGLIIADNVYGSGDWWIDDVGHASREGADQFNRAVANDPDFDAVAIPLRHGVLIGRRKS